MFSLETLRDYESRGLLKSSERDGYIVWCYTQQAVVERAWDEVTVSCRGLITTSEGELVALPFRKFFNWSEPEAVVEDGPFFAYDKMDGTLIVVGNHNGEAVVSTKGSFDTWHSERARELLYNWTPPEGHTALFELITPENRIVIDYGNYEGLVFLGGIDNATGADAGIRANDTAIDWAWHGDVVVERNFNLQSMLKTIQTPDAGQGREGFVVVWRKPGAPSNRIKLKFDLYVRLHGIYTGLTNRRVWECLVEGTLDALLELAPDELHEAIKSTAAEIEAEADRLKVPAREVGLSARRYASRKEAAEYILTNLDRPLQGLAFKVYDGKGIDEDALRLVRPSDSRFVGSAGLA